MEALRVVRDFLDVGGWPLTLIGCTSLLMWSLMIERLLYFRPGPQRLGERAIETWRDRRERGSWEALQVRRLLISEATLRAQRFIPVIRAIISVCPMLGLLGTVTGMIEVFEVMTIAGTANPRAMAGGISKAMITTVAGLVTALSGLITITYIDRLADEVQLHLLSRLHTDEAEPSSRHAA